MGKNSFESLYLDIFVSLTLAYSFILIVIESILLVFEAISGITMNCFRWNSDDFRPIVFNSFDISSPAL